MSNGVMKSIIGAKEDLSPVRLTSPPFGQPEVIEVGEIKDEPENPYVRIIQGNEVDVYRILKAWGITDPGIQHAIKKLLRNGRAGKNAAQDKMEAIQAIQRSLQIEEEDA